MQDSITKWSEQERDTLKRALVEYLISLEVLRMRAQIPLEAAPDMSIASDEYNRLCMVNMDIETARRILKTLLVV